MKTSADDDFPQTVHEAAAGAGVNRPVGLEAQYNPLIEGVQAEIDNLTTLKDLSVETQSSEQQTLGSLGTYLLCICSVQCRTLATVH